MGTLYVDRSGAQLDFDRGALVIREPDVTPRSIPLNLVERLVVVGNIQISARLLTRLADCGAGVIVMPGRGQRRSTFMHGVGHGDVARRVGQYRLTSDGDAQMRWARRLVWLRLAGQRRLLNAALGHRADLRQPIVRALREVQLAMYSVRMDASRLDSLRGMEGAATAAYFRGYQRLFADGLEFRRRNRRPPRDPVNAALSLGYTLVHGDALRAVSHVGLEPMLGVLHEPAYSRDSLACDLAELARIRVERMVWRLFASQRLDAESFGNDNGAVRLRKRSREVFFRSYETMAPIHRRWLARVARVFARDCAARAGELAVEGAACNE